MRAAALLAIHLLVLLAKSLKRGGIKSVIAENSLLKQQLIVMGRTRLKTPNLNERCGGDQAPESQIRLHTHRLHHCIHLRYRDQQRCGSSYSRKTLQARKEGCTGTFLAKLAGSKQGQSLEY